MILQWCCKGVSGIGPSEAKQILSGGSGLICRLWQTNNPLPYQLAMERLSERHLDLHVNHYDGIDPETGTRVRDVTAFISLSAGCVDRDVMLRTNVVNPARRTALEFATDLGSRDGWLFTCYVLVSVNRAASSPAVAEEVRNLNQLRRYSDYWLEGEVAAKVNVPSRQILAAEHWQPSSGGIQRTGGYVNTSFVHPHALLNMREML